jgi:hypothetical protein
MYKLVKITKSQKPDKKLCAVFLNTTNNRTKTIHFGSAGMEDFTLHKDPERKKRYIARHRKNEDWNNPVTAGSLSRYILWNKLTLKDSIADYKRRFKF